MKHLLINYLLSISLFGQIPPKDFSSWEILQDEKIWIGNYFDEFPWCKAKIILP